jgi:hypothetical protein
MTNKPSAQIICDSVAPNGVRLTTFVVTFHRYILAEVNTHKVISKNSASSRAIPSKVIIQKILDNPALPIHFGLNQAGMQASNELEQGLIDEAKRVWKDASTSIITRVNYLVNNLKLHKQVANRLLEPFNWHTAILTATDFDNMFWQRCHKDAQPEFKALADAMQYAYYMGDPKTLQPGQWHLPYADDPKSIDECIEVAASQHTDGRKSAPEDEVLEIQKQLSVGRCAGVSYLNHDGDRDVSHHLNVYDKLLTGMHPSPFEHQGSPCEHTLAIESSQLAFLENSLTDTLQVRCKYQGNFSTGWHQLRKFIKGENRLNFIPNLPGLEKQAEILKAGGKLW